jgi:hypothetical protein
MEKYQEEVKDNSIYCSHCDDMVTRSTYIRHQKKRSFVSKHLANIIPESSSSSSDEEGKLLFSCDII